MPRSSGKEIKTRVSRKPENIVVHEDTMAPENIIATIKV